MQRSQLLAWARNSYVIGLVLAIVFIIPVAWFPLQLGKVALFSICAAVGAIFFLMSGGWQELWRGGALKAAFLVGLLPIVYLASFFFSTDRSVGFAGFSIEGDTVVFTLLCFLAFLFSFGLFRTASGVRRLLLGLSGAIAFASLFQLLLVIIGPSVFSLAVFSDKTVNLIGKWNDLGLLAGLLAVLVLGWLEFVSVSKTQRIGGSIALIALGLLLSIVQFSFVWTLLFCFSLVFVVASFIAKRPEEDHEAANVPVPWLPVVVAIVSALFLLWGSLFSSGISSVFPVSSFEVRPSFSSTLDVIRASHGNSPERFLLGTGPQTFGEQWLLHKPTDINQTPFWNLDFSVGYTSFLTVLGSVGVLGALAWLAPLFLALLGLLRILRSANFGAGEKMFGSALGISSLYLWVNFLFYVPSQNSILLGFILCGATFGFSVKSAEPFVLAGRRRGVASLSMLVLVLMLLFIAGGVVRRAVSTSVTNAGVSALGQGDVDGALALAARAGTIEQTANSLRLAVDAGGAKLQQISATTNPSSDVQAQFAAQVKQTITEAQSAIAAAPQDYRVYISLGNIYTLLLSLGATDAYASGKNAYDAAARSNPTNPQIPLLLARLESIHKDNAATEANLAQALTLKPDYTDAMLFMVQYSVANNDLQKAITAATAAVRSAPGVSSIWFQLGLLYYSNSDTASAIPVLEQAIKLQPGYANAQYFLGLSYAAQKRPQEAIAQFEDLVKTNPDNEEIKLILGNLQAGKDPFLGAKPPVTSSIQGRTSAPISQ